MNVKVLLGRKIYLTFAFFVVVAVSLFLLYPIFVGTIYSKEYPIKIKGDLICQKQTRDALDLIKEKANEEFLFVIKYIGVIHCVSAGSGMFAAEAPPRAQLGDKTRNTGTLWYASALVHESCHSKQYQDRLDDPPAKSQEDLKRASEAECLEFQAKAAEKMGASEYLIKYIKDAINTGYWHGPSMNNY